MQACVAPGTERAGQHVQLLRWPKTAFKHFLKRPHLQLQKGGVHGTTGRSSPPCLPPGPGGQPARNCHGLILCPLGLGSCAKGQGPQRPAGGGREVGGGAAGAAQRAPWRGDPRASGTGGGRGPAAAPLAAPAAALAAGGSRWRKADRGSPRRGDGGGRRPARRRICCG